MLSFLSNTRVYLAAGTTHMFIGLPDAGWRSAVIDSLLITARRYWLDAAALLSDVLRRIPTCTEAKLPKLLPWNWKPKAA